MFNKIVVLLTAFALAFALTACGQAEKDSENKTDEPAQEETAVEPLAGGWTIVDNDAAALPDEVQKAFDKAVEKFTGSELKPVAYVASQVVAGMNYMILCEATTTTAEPVKSYKMIVIYADLKDNAEITQINDFDLSAYTSKDDADIKVEDFAGGWIVPEQRSQTVFPDEALDAFDKATKEIGGTKMEPLALLATQVVSGTNYAFICTNTLMTEEPVTGVQIVTVYADLNDDAEIINICTLDPADFNK